MKNKVSERKQTSILGKGTAWTKAPGLGPLFIKEVKGQVAGVQETWW